MNEQVTITREMASRLAALVDDAIMLAMRERAPKASTLRELRQLRTDLAIATVEQFLADCHDRAIASFKARYGKSA